MPTFKVRFVEVAHDYMSVVADSAEEALGSLKYELEEGYIQPDCCQDPEITIEIYSEDGDCLLAEEVDTF